MALSSGYASIVILSPVSADVSLFSVIIFLSMFFVCMAWFRTCMTFPSVSFSCFAYPFTVSTSCGRGVVLIVRRYLRIRFRGCYVVLSGCCM